MRVLSTVCDPKIEKQTGANRDQILIRLISLPPPTYCVELYLWSSCLKARHTPLNFTTKPYKNCTYSGTARRNPPFGDLQTETWRQKFSFPPRTHPPSRCLANLHDPLNKPVPNFISNFYAGATRDRLLLHGLKGECTASAVGQILKASSQHCSGCTGHGSHFSLIIVLVCRNCVCLSVFCYFVR
jgi:hypothetical protein